MIKTQIIEDFKVDCKIHGTAPQIVIEYNSVVIGMIKRLRDVEKKTDEEIERFLVESIAFGFKAIEKPGGVIEKHDFKG